MRTLFSFWIFFLLLGVEGSGKEALDSFFDKNVDYSVFMGRVTDKDAHNQTLKIQTETQNIKFLRAGDEVTFKIAQEKKGFSCVGHVRGTEKNYLILFVVDIGECHPSEDYFRRGTQLNLRSPQLYRRIIHASRYRNVLIKSRKDFLAQLGKVNHFLWTFDQEKVKTSARFDQQILAIKNEKQQALDLLVSKKMENIILQKEIGRQLDLLDESLNFYWVDQQEPLVDRWNMDQDLGLPVGRRPQKVQKVEFDEKNAWFGEEKK